MSTSVQQIVDAALASHVENRGLSLLEDGAAGDTEVIRQVNLAEQALFQRLAAAGRTFRLVTATGNSSAGSTERQIVVQGALRVVRMTLTNGDVPIALVDPRDPDAEWGPRAIVGAAHSSGLLVTEVAASWDEGSNAAVSVTVVASAAPATLDALADTVATPDEHTELLVNRLAYYLRLKDAGSDPVDLERLDARYERLFADFVSFCDLTSGSEARLYRRPAPESKP